MIKRREFLKKAAAVTAAYSMLPMSMNACTGPQGSLDEIGLQLYTLRDLVNGDLGFEKTLRGVADIGYDYLELWDYNNGMYFDRTVKETRQLLEDLGMRCVSAHYATGVSDPGKVGTIVNGWEKAVADAAEMGQAYMGIASIDGKERKRLDDYKVNAARFNKAAEKCKEYGIQFAYHNHEFEFEELEGRIPMEVLLEETDPELVKVELDIYWINRAGFSEQDFFKEYAGRVHLWHVKDIANTKERLTTEIGSGTLDWQRVFQNAGLSGMTYFFVEQEAYGGKSPMESARMSFDYLKGLKF